MMVNNKVFSLLFFGSIFLGNTSYVFGMDDKSTMPTFEYSQEKFSGSIRRTMYRVEAESKKKLGVISISKAAPLKGLASMPKAVADQIPGFSEIIEMVNLLVANKYDLGKIVMLGDVYISPELRGKGYAKILVENTCKTIAEDKEVEHIVLIPQPFEYVDNKQTILSAQPDYQEKVQKLIKLYKKCGFKKLDETSNLMIFEKNKSASTCTKR